MTDTGTLSEILPMFQWYIYVVLLSNIWKANLNELGYIDIYSNQETLLVSPATTFLKVIKNFQIFFLIP